MARNDKQNRATAEFLESLAKHWGDNEMPGQAGNCTIHAKALHAMLDAPRKPRSVKVASDGRATTKTWPPQKGERSAGTWPPALKPPGVNKPRKPPAGDGVRKPLPADWQ